MNTMFTQLFSDASGRYLTTEEAGHIAEYARSVPVRLKAMQTVESVEAQIVEETVAEVFRRHPQFASKHAHAREKCLRDVSYVLRYCALFMVRNDMEGLKEKLLYWFQSIVHSFEFADTISTTYGALMRSCERHLPEKFYELLSPYLQMTLDILSRPPEEN